MTTGDEAGVADGGSDTTLAPARSGQLRAPSTPAVSLDRSTPRSVAQRLDAMVAEWETTGDRRAIFADAYGHMTSRMGRAIEDDQFGDGEWVGRLLDGFADYYFVACDSHQAGGDACPVAWRHAMDACDDDGTHPLQVLLLGINAHINHDLVFALADVLDDWQELPPASRDLRLADHRRVNTVIASTVDDVQDDVVSRWCPAMGTLDRALGPVDEWVSSRLIGGWRQDVWGSTQELLMAGEDDRATVERAIQERARRMSRLILAF